MYSKNSRDAVLKISYNFSYSELVEIHRIDEATATPVWEGASLSEIIRTIRGLHIERLESAYLISGLFCANKRSHFELLIRAPFNIRKEKAHGKTLIYF